MLPDEVVTNRDVLGLAMLHRVVSYLDGTFIVTKEGGLPTLHSIILQGLLHPKELCTTTSGGHVLGLGGGERNTILFL